MDFAVKKCLHFLLFSFYLRVRRKKSLGETLKNLITLLGTRKDAVVSTKSPIIDFPAQVSLNEQGEEFFSRMGVPLKSVTGMSGRKRLGFQANSLEAPFMKILLRQNYFEEIYGVAHTLVQKRKEL